MSDETMAKCMAQLLAYRKKHFAVEIESVRFPDESGEVLLNVTKNGRQWQSISLLRDEVVKVIAALKATQKP